MRVIDGRAAGATSGALASSRLIALSSTIGSEDELARYRHAWDHAADRTPHGQPIELRGEDFPG